MYNIVALQHAMPAIDASLRKNGYIVVSAQDCARMQISAYLYTGHRSDPSGYHFGALPVDRQVGWPLPAPFIPWPLLINVSGLSPDEVLFILKYRLALVKRGS